MANSRLPAYVGGWEVAHFEELFDYPRPSRELPPIGEGHTYFHLFLDGGFTNPMDRDKIEQSRGICVDMYGEAQILLKISGNATVFDKFYTLEAMQRGGSDHQLVYEGSNFNIPIKNKGIFSWSYCRENLIHKIHDRLELNIGKNFP